MPISLTVYDNLVYVLNAGHPGTGNIAGFWLSNSGTLSYIAGSSQPLSAASGTSAEQIGFNPDGNVLVVTETGTNIIDTYTSKLNGSSQCSDNSSFSWLRTLWICFHRR